MPKKRKPQAPSAWWGHHHQLDVNREVIEHHFAAVKLASLEGITHAEELDVLVAANVAFLDAVSRGGFRRG